MTRIRCRSLSAWLALFAMLMIFIAPVVSQSVAMARVGTDDICGPSQRHDQYKPAQQNAHHDPYADSANKASQDEPAPLEHTGHSHEKCGYCTLVAQLPLLVSSGSDTHIVNAATHKPLPAGVPSTRVSPAVFPNALSRAPPSDPLAQNYPTGA